MPLGDSGSLYLFLRCYNSHLLNASESKMCSALRSQDVAAVSEVDDDTTVSIKVSMKVGNLFRVKVENLTRGLFRMH